MVWGSGAGEVDVAELIDMDSAALAAEGAKVRDRAHGNRVTFSPKVFIPLTMLCRDRCGYCTFAKPPARLGRPYLTHRRGAGDRRRRPGRRLPRGALHPGRAARAALPGGRRWLAEHGYASTVDYLADACRARCSRRPASSPTPTPAPSTGDELAALRPVTASQGMMLETLAEDLDAHRRAPDKAPARRLATLEAAGELAIPFTTGILVGIGETRADRIDALEAIAAAHRRHGHVQEVIVQNFLPKPGTAMARAPPCPPDELLWSIAVARLLLPPEVHLQAPPNLSDDLGAAARRRASTTGVGSRR